MSSSGSMLAPVLVLVSAFFVATSCSAQAWTEARVVELFVRQSPQSVAARAQIAVTRAEAEGRALYSNPSFSFSREGAGYAAFFQAEQALPLTGRVGLLRRAVAPAAGAAEAEAEALVWQLRAEVRLAFYRQLALQEREAVLAATLKDLAEVVRVLRTREREGEGSRFDRLRAEREVVEVRTELASLQALAAQARGRVLEFLPQGTEIMRLQGTMVPSLEVPALPDLVSLALAARAEIRAGDRLIARLRLEEQAAGRLRYPEPVVAAGLKRGDVISIAPAGRLQTEGVQNGLVVGVSIPIPSFNRGQAEVARVQAEQNRIEARRRALEREVRAQVSRAYESLVLRRGALQSYRQELGDRNQELLTIAQTAYQEGEVGILELLDVLRLQRQSDLRLIELGAATREAAIELERVLGEEVTK